MAKKRRLPRIAGHKAGLDAVKRTVQACGEKGIKVLTLFAFSSENWQRPAEEVTELLNLFLMVLQREINKLHKNNVCLKVIGDISKFTPKLQQKIKDAETLTQNNTGLTLLIAANYGGRWDITQAIKTIASKIAAEEIDPNTLDENTVAKYISTAPYPDPDLLIRTSGEHRISNFLLWQLAYSELYITDTYWPDFSESDLDAALKFYQSRERRFGCTSEQLISS